MPYPGTLLFPSSGLYPGGGSDPPPLVDDSLGSDPPDLLDDLPPFEQESDDIQLVLRVISDELALVENRRQQVLSNFFPRTANALLPFFEMMFGLTPNLPNRSVDERTQAVLAFFRRLKSQGTGREWENTITRLIGTNWSYQELTPYMVLVTLPFAASGGAPAGLAVNPGAGGSLPNGTYYYAVSATTSFGETLACTPVSFTAAAGDAVSTWTPEPSVTGYNVYRGASPSVLYRLAHTTSPTFDDDGSIGLSAHPAPRVDSSGSSLAGIATHLIRSVTPAHIAIQYGFTGGFLVGESLIGLSPL